jgi:L-rhamnose-H+ transport protein
MPPHVLGLIYHWIGGLASASFYIPYRGVRGWAWESYWLVGGVFSWVIGPWAFAGILVPDLWEVLSSSPVSNLIWAFIFGALWGIGGLTFGLTMRYLGIALGMAVALGFCAAFGTIMPPLFEGELAGLVASRGGRWILAGVVICLCGIGLNGLAGMAKEREVPDAEKKASIREFNFGKGIAVAIVSGILSACMSYGFAAGRPIAEIAGEHLARAGAADLWANLPVLVVVLAGGFTTNLIWCVYLNLRNGTASDYIGGDKTCAQVPLLRNYGFSALAGMTWYLQFFFYSMGETRMGEFKFSSWTLHMASIIIFGTFWGIALREWRGTTRRTHLLIVAGLIVLVGSTAIIGYGNYLGSSAPQ